MNSKSSFLSEKQIEKLYEYLKEFYNEIKPTKPVNGWSEPINQEFLNELINDPLQQDIHNFHKNNINLLNIDDGYPKAFRNEEDKIVAIQLREIDSDKLLLGCGNNPTSICYHYPLSKDFEKECISYGSSEWWSNTIIQQTKSDIIKGKTYEHKEYITIDPNITITEIYTEGIDLSNLPIFDQEYEKLTGKEYNYNSVIDIAFI